METSDLTLWGVVATAIGLIIKIIRDETPKALSHYRESRVRRMDLEEQRLGEERQDDVATFANMISLQTRMSVQNERLMDYFIRDFRQDIVDLRHMVTSLEAKLESGTEDIDRRWLTNSLELRQVSAQQRIITTEFVALKDAIADFQTKMEYALSCLPDLMEDDVTH